MVVKNYKNQQTSPYLDQSEISSSDNNVCVPNSMGSNFSSNKTKYKDKSKKKIQKLSQEKNLAILSEKDKLYCLTDLKNTKWSYTNQIGLKLNQRFQKNSPTEIIELYEETNFESEKHNSHLLSTSSFFPSDKEMEIQKYPDKNGQYSREVQHQQKIGSEKFISQGKEDMEIIREKLLNIFQKG
jgi:hypothetical protein